MGALKEFIEMQQEYLKAHNDIGLSGISNERRIELLQMASELAKLGYRAGDMGWLLAFAGRVRIRGQLMDKAEWRRSIRYFEDVMNASGAWDDVRD